MTPPHELEFEFVVDVPVCGSVSRHASFDVHRPEGVDLRLPAVVIVRGRGPPSTPFGRGTGLFIGATVSSRWLAESPDWLRCLALTYPMWITPDADTPAETVAPGRPLLLTRVGRELPERQAMVDRFLARARATGTDVRVIDVPDGQHGFDALDHTEQSRQAVLDATDLVVGHLLD